MNLLLLPNELLQMIVDDIDYHKVTAKLVCKSFYRLCHNRLRYNDISMAQKNNISLPTICISVKAFGKKMLHGQLRKLLSLPITLVGKNTQLYAPTLLSSTDTHTYPFLCPEVKTFICDNEKFYCRYCVKCCNTFDLFVYVCHVYRPTNPENCEQMVDQLIKRYLGEK